MGVLMVNTVGWDREYGTHYLCRDNILKTECDKVTHLCAARVSGLSNFHLVMNLKRQKMCGRRGGWDLDTWKYKSMQLKGTEHQCLEQD